jgi:hypothetical protein
MNGQGRDTAQPPPRQRGMEEQSREPDSRAKAGNGMPSGSRGGKQEHRRVSAFDPKDGCGIAGG